MGRVNEKIRVLRGWRQNWLVDWLSPLFQDFTIKDLVQLCLCGRKLIMAPSSKRQKTAEDKEQETFRKRRRGLQKKTHELSRFTNTDSYLVMFREGRYYLYSSVNRDGWPPSQSDIVSTRTAFSYLMETDPAGHKLSALRAQRPFRFPSNSLPYPTQTRLFLTG